MDISKNLKILRMKNHMTQGELAKKLGISRSAVGNYENGTRTPDLETIQSICKIFDITYNTLLDGNWKSYEKEIQNDFASPLHGTDESGYYLDPETAAIAQEIHDNPELRALFSASRKASPESLQAVANLIKSMKDET